MYSLESFALLEEKNIFIHYDIEHYDDGCNLNFSIEFRDYPRAQTYWYNDNHEFGDIVDAMKASLAMAFWYAEDPERIKSLNGTYTEGRDMDIQLNTFMQPFIKH